MCEFDGRCFVALIRLGLPYVTHVISSFLEQLGTVITKGVQGKTKLLKVKHALSETRQAIAPGCDLLWHDHWRAP